MRVRRYLEWAVYGMGGAYGALFLFSASLRLIYPYEVEWNEGAILDHAIRVLHGQSIYTAPSLDFSAFVYTPLYYVVTAALMKIGAIGLWAGRLVSIISTLCTAWFAGKIVRRETASALLAFSAGMLYLAFYQTTGFFYDIVRMDALAILFAILSLYAALYLRRGYVTAAIFIALAYYTKQQMIFIWPGITVLLFLRQKKDALIFAVLSIALLLITFVSLNGITHGWFQRYTMTIPSLKAASEFSWITALEFFPKIVIGSLGLFTFIIVVAFFTIKRVSFDRIFFALCICYVLAISSGAISLGNPGGYSNVIMPCAAMTAIVFPIALHRIFEKISVTTSLSLVLLFLGFLSLWYDPLSQKMLFASQRQKHAGDEFIAKLRSMSGDVWIPYHGYISSLAGKPTHVHFMAMNDALYLGDTTARRYRHEIDSSLAAHRFAAIILDEDSVFHWDSIPHYTRSEAIFVTPNVFLSRIGSAPTRPQFIYRPIP